MKIVIPLAGKDKDFEARGLIKPLTKIAGKELIRRIAESRPYSLENAIFIVLKEHDEKFSLSEKLKEFFGDNITTIIIDKMTEGSPQSILLAKDLINNDEELLIDLGDQYLDLTGFTEFLENNKESCDGIISTFKAHYWNQGYMEIDEKGFVQRVSEKDKTPISTDSTACISYFKKGSDFVKYAEQMITKKRTAANGVYLPSLTYNEMIEDNKKIITCPCDFIVNLGRVEGADVFEQINRPLKWKTN
jgi:NDP-sugar pyrophosphorylase family protein